MGESRGEKTALDAVATKAHNALKDGNFALARSLARSVLGDTSASEKAQSEAREVLDATRVDRAPLIVGFVMLVVLTILFGWVLTRH